MQNNRHPHPHGGPNRVNDYGSSMKNSLQSNVPSFVPAQFQQFNRNPGQTIYQAPPTFEPNPNYVYMYQPAQTQVQAPRPFLTSINGQPTSIMNMNMNMPQFQYFTAQPFQPAPQPPPQNQPPAQIQYPILQKPSRKIIEIRDPNTGEKINLAGVTKYQPTTTIDLSTSTTGNNVNAVAFNSASFIPNTGDYSSYQKNMTSMASSVIVDEEHEQSIRDQFASKVAATLQDNHHYNLQQQLQHYDSHSNPNPSPKTAVEAPQVINKSIAPDNDVIISQRPSQMMHYDATVHLTHHNIESTNNANINIATDSVIPPKQYIEQPSFAIMNNVMMPTTVENISCAGVSSSSKVVPEMEFQPLVQQQQQLSFVDKQVPVVDERVVADQSQYMHEQQQHQIQMHKPELQQQHKLEVQQHKQETQQQVHKIEELVQQQQQKVEVVPQFIKSEVSQQQQQQHKQDAWSKQPKQETQQQQQQQQHKQQSKQQNKINNQNDQQPRNITENKPKQQPATTITTTAATKFSQQTTISSGKAPTSPTNVQQEDSESEWIETKSKNKKRNKGNNKDLSNHQDRHQSHHHQQQHQQQHQHQQQQHQQEHANAGKPAQETSSQSKTAQAPVTITTTTTSSTISTDQQQPMQAPPLPTTTITKPVLAPPVWPLIKSSNIIHSQSMASSAANQTKPTAQQQQSVVTKPGLPVKQPTTPAPPFPTPANQSQGPPTSSAANNKQQLASSVANESSHNDTMSNKTNGKQVKRDEPVKQQEKPKQQEQQNVKGQDKNKQQQQQNVKQQQQGKQRQNRNQRHHQSLEKEKSTVKPEEKKLNNNESDVEVKNALSSKKSNEKPEPKEEQKIDLKEDLKKEVKDELKDELKDQKEISAIKTHQIECEATVSISTAAEQQQPQEPSIDVIPERPTHVLLTNSTVTELSQPTVQEIKSLEHDKVTITSTLPTPPQQHEQQPPSSYSSDSLLTSKHLQSSESMIKEDQMEQISKENELELVKSDNDDEMVDDTLTLTNATTTSATITTDQSAIVSTTTTTTSRIAGDKTITLDNEYVNQDGANMVNTNADEIGEKVVNNLSSSDSCENISEDNAEETGEDQKKEGLEEEKEAKPTLRYNYSEDQWSPMNPEGKKAYDRNFLLQIQFSDFITKPELPPLDIVLNKPNLSRQDSILSNASSGGEQTSMMDYVKSSSSSMNRGYSNKKGMGGSGGGGQNQAKRQLSNDHGQRKVIEIKLQSNVNIQLHTAENAWKPKKEDSDLTEIVYKKVRGILNKLTPEKFQTLIEQLKHLPINTEERLKGCIDIIFEKAVSEPKFAIAYANMGKCLVGLSVPLDAKPEENVSFRKLLLTKCQTEFEKDKEEEEEIATIQQKIDEASSEKDKKKLTDEKNEAISRAKRRSLGNIKFIGELFKLKMLTEKIMHECLMKLLRQSEDEDSLECLCQLLTTIGKDIDQGGSKIHMDSYFEKMKGFVELKRTSHRIRFMILDVFDLRKTGWVPRRENNPKPIGQIHKEAKKEEEERQHKAAIFDQTQRRKQNEQRYNQPNILPSSSSNIAEDGWTSVSVYKLPKATQLDMSKIKLGKTNIDDNFQLGGRGGWARGSMGGAALKTTTPSEPEKPMLNRYALLSNSIDSNDPSRMFSSLQLPSHDLYKGRSSGPQNQLSNKTTTISRNSQEKLSQQSSDERSKSPMPTLSRPTTATIMTTTTTINNPPSTKTPAVKNTTTDNLSIDYVERKTKSIIDEYIHLKDIKEAVECLKELNIKGNELNARRFFYHSMELTVERSNQVRVQIGTLHRHLLTKDLVVSPLCYTAAITRLANFAVETVIDIPQIWEYIGEIVCPLFLGGHEIPLNFLVAPIKKIPGEEDYEFSEEGLELNKARLLAVVLEALSKQLGHHAVGELWKKSKLKWEELVKDMPVADFIKKYELEYTTQSDDVHGRSRRNRLVSVNENKNELIELFAKPTTIFQHIHDWIHDNLYLSDEKNNPLDLKSVSDCCTALCMSCLSKRPDTDEYQLEEEERLVKFLPVIKTLTVDRPDRQLEVLFGLQELAARLAHPPNLLYRLFELVYDAEVTNEQAFHQWRDDTTRNSHGKGVALQSVSRFFDWLAEEEKDAHA